MELEIRPHKTNEHPLLALVIQSKDILVWLTEIHRLDLSLEKNSVYAIPDNTANSVWGCVVLLHQKIDESGLEKNQLFQVVGNLLAIPSNSVLYPQINIAELTTLLRGKKHLLHPAIGLVELEEPIDWSSIIESATLSDVRITVPEQGIYLPSDIHTCRFAEAKEDDILKQMEDSLFPKKEKMKDKPLSTGEKIKLNLLRALFGKGEGKIENSSLAKSVPSKFMEKLAGLFSSIKSPEWVDKLAMDLDELEKRNQKEVDKLIDFLKNNPEEALKYAIPFNQGERGSREGLFSMSKFGNNLDFNSSSSSGSARMSEDLRLKLYNQYLATAEALEKEKKYKEAAYIYFKLLGNKNKAAELLELGKFYTEAAAIYQKHLQNKKKAAECYEKGFVYEKAISLYQELNMHEKAGDTYMKIGKRDRAVESYTRVANDYISNNQYVMASLVYRNKIGNPQSAQTFLLQGWRKGLDASNCLNNYFNNIRNTEQLLHEIERVYEQDTNPQNVVDFLNVIKHEYSNHPEIKDEVREVALKIISNEIQNHPETATRMLFFTKDEKRLLKDVQKFKMNKVKRR